ncbi:MAG: lamin tail domain-containing protein, partial [bacterium]|nr:lamin tail domain-containing protein [bacterium]
AGPLAGVVVNEILSHGNPAQKDTVELHNPGAATVDIGGWYLSNSSGDYEKFQIPGGTSIPAGGYLVFDEDDFNPTPGTPGPDDFDLDGAREADVWLMKTGPGGKLSHFADHAEIGAAAMGESWGRWPNGSGEFHPMISTTLDKAQPEEGLNSGPRVGPVIISEVHYHPTAGKSLGLPAAGKSLGLRVESLEQEEKEATIA